MNRSLAEQASCRVLNFSYTKRVLCLKLIRNPRYPMNQTRPWLLHQVYQLSYSASGLVGDNHHSYNWAHRFCFGYCTFPKGYASAAAEAGSSIDESDLFCSDNHGIVNEMKKIYLPKNIKMSKFSLLKKRQIAIETEAWEGAAKEYQEMLKDMCRQKLAPNLPYIKSLFLGWFEPLRDAIAAEQKLCNSKKGKMLHQISHMTQLPADMMAVITMHKLMGMLLSDSEGIGRVTLIQAACAVGEAIEHEANIYRFLDKSKRKNKNTMNNERSPTEEEEKQRKKVAVLIKLKKARQLKDMMKSYDDSESWGLDVQVKIGCRLIQMLIETAYMQPPIDQLGDTPVDIRPAFTHTTANFAKDESGRKVTKCGVIQCDPLICRGLEKSARYMVIPYMPMLIPPLNWKGYDQGAYLFLPSFVMRIHGAKKQREAIKRAPLTQLECVFEALNTLGNTKWRINKKVLAVVERIWASGTCLAGLVGHENVPLPVKPNTENKEEIQKWKWKLINVERENGERNSQRCATELQLSVARRLKDEDGFYYPHNIDFRGRAYPMHPYLNHLGSDLCRGILEFAEGRPVGKSGLCWLKIHLANLYAHGVDKLSYEGRIAFAENHLDDIFDSADQPLEGNRWWLRAEDPFQCLAACFSLAETLRSSCPVTTMSHTPVHQDGSCNGLQHYAALGRDKLGAAAVNIEHGEKPADVYSSIATMVLNILSTDAEKDPVDNPASLHARVLINQVDRKLVKQTVMTSVYGVTYMGARDQILKRLKERHVIEDGSQLFAASCYAAETTLTALGQMFKGARNIMHWLGECAKVISLKNEAVQWITPVGLPVVQPYRYHGKRTIKTSLQLLTINTETDKIMVRKQKTAFPPNFVHSLDSSHMMMTAIACKEAGLNFAGVHDSYWTHACDVDKLNKILREKFIKLYELPILENLLRGFQQSFPNQKFPPLPERGDLDLKSVLDSPYFFN